MRLGRWLGAIVIIAAASPVAADIYVWRDDSGVSHYTNDLSNVPQEFRGDAITVAKDWARAEPPPEPVAPAAAAPAPVDDSSAAAVAAARDVPEAAAGGGPQDGEREPAAAPADDASSVAQTLPAPPQAAVDAGRMIAVPVVAERRQPPRHDHRGDAPGDAGGQDVLPASRAPVPQRPAVPPPVGER